MPEFLGGELSASAGLPEGAARAEVSDQTKRSPPFPKREHRTKKDSPRHE